MKRATVTGTAARSDAIPEASAELIEVRNRAQILCAWLEFITIVTWEPIVAVMTVIMLLITLVLFLLSEQQ